MKQLFLAALIILSYNGCVSPLCGCSPPPTNRDFIIGGWLSNGVSLDGTDVDDWQDFKVYFEWDSFRTENSQMQEVWPDTGTYEFASGNGADLSILERSDSVVMNIDYLNDSTLSLSFTEETTGKWIFNFDRSQQ